MEKNTETIQDISNLSPFEIKNTLIKIAKEDSNGHSGTYLNAGRGNPNWVATEPRDAFFLLGTWAMEEARDEFYIKPGVAGLPSSEGLGERLKLFLEDNSARRGAHLLRKSIDYCEKELGISPDDLAAEWANGILGDHYPTPPRILKETEKIIAAYMAQEMGNHASGYGSEFDLFATEGGTAAMCYIFDSLVANKLLERGDKIALMTPIFTPYIEIPRLREYDFDVTNIGATTTNAEGFHTWDYPDSELEKLKDTRIKLLCLVNPSNPPSYVLSQKSVDKLKDIVAHYNPNLMIITDDVYGTFARSFRSLMYEIPDNTLCVYSYSKYFGATGWRLAVITALKDNNLFDRLLEAQDDKTKEELEKRYESLVTPGEKLKFIDRMVADSRSVALNHTAGLSTPQQVMMSLFSLMCLLDVKDAYKKKMQKLIDDRLEALWKGTGFTLVENPLRVGYYSEIDLLAWGNRIYGDSFGNWLTTNHNPLDLVLSLARETSVVLLNGGGFDGPEWSVRASLANLDEAAYLKIGAAIRKIMDSYYEEFKNSLK